QRAQAARPDLLPAAELLRLCTFDGARALGMEDRIGSLEPGKDADLCAVAVTGSHMVPSFDPVTALFHAARGADVTLAAVRGRVLYRDGSVLTIDEGEARAGVDAAAERLRGASVP